MPISFTCPHCGNQTSVADQYAGQTGPCTECGKPITVPGNPFAAAPAVRSSGSGTGIIVVVVVVGVLVFVGLILMGLLFPAIQAAREAARRAACLNNMKQLSLAMTSYHSTHGCYPPAYLTDADGQPMHSWRVLILPHLGESTLYQMYDFDEPWDSLKNQAVTAQIPKVYQCPSDSGDDPAATNYMMIVGSATISDGPNSCQHQQMRDGLSGTIMLVEVAGTGTHWAEPRDLDADRISFAINDGSRTGIGSNHRGGACVAMCDGSVQFFDDSIDPQVMEALSTISGGENVGVPRY